MKIVLASNNLRKLDEINAFFKNSPYQFISQASLNVSEIPETGLSFVENAILKARNASQQTQLPAIADDSGLVVDALLGAPGIYSARYAGDKASDRQNIEKLLDALKDTSDENRSAHFRCAIVYVAHARDPVPIICEGIWDGKILFQPQGEHGFGYDPIFYVPTHQCAAAELSITEKNKISHRGLALQCLKEKLFR